MTSKEYKLVCIATGIGFLFGLFTLIAFEVIRPETAIAQTPKMGQLPRTDMQVPSKVPGMQEFTVVKAEVAEIKNLKIMNALELYNGGGKLVATLGVNDGLPNMTFYDPRDGMARMKFSLEDQGSPMVALPKIYLLDKQGRNKVVSYVQSDGEGSIAIYGPNNKLRFQVSSDPKFGTKLYLGFEDDKWSLLQSNVWSSELVVQHSNARNQYGTVIKN